MAGKDFGGRMTVRLSSGKMLALRGTFSTSAGRTSSEPVTNQDGSMDRVFTPKSPSATITFRDADVSADDLLEAPRQNIVINEEHTGVTHHYIDAVFTGNHESNRINGEASGLTIVGETYRKTGG
jgi:hypothetical protein